MAPKQKDITGQRFGRLIILSEDSRRKRANRPGTEVFWKCLCDCGNTTVVKRGSLTSKTTQSCGCRKRDAVLARNKLCRKDGTALRSLYNAYQQRARKSGLVFELSIEDFQRITSEPCFYTGRLPEKEARNRAGSERYLYNGVDRVDNSIGYVLGNCVACCYDANMAKHTQTFDGFVKMCHQVASCHPLKP